MKPENISLPFFFSHSIKQTIQFIHLQQRIAMCFMSLSTLFMKRREKLLLLRHVFNSGTQSVLWKTTILALVLHRCPDSINFIYRCKEWCILSLKIIGECKDPCTDVPNMSWIWRWIWHFRFRCKPSARHKISEIAVSVLLKYYFCVTGFFFLGFK